VTDLVYYLTEDRACEIWSKHLLVMSSLVVTCWQRIARERYEYTYCLGRGLMFYCWCFFYSPLSPSSVGRSPRNFAPWWVSASTL